MKKLIYLFLAAIFLLAAVAACSPYVPFERIYPNVTTPNDVGQVTPPPHITEPPRVTTPPEPPPLPPEFNPTEDWEIALVEYLSQYTPIFRNARFYENFNWWGNDWEHYVYWITNPESSGYGYNFIFRDPDSGERLNADDTLFIRSNISYWYDEYDMRHEFLSMSIATGFELVKLDESGVPMLIIHWEIQFAMDPGGPSTLHRFQNGTFEYVQTLSEWDSVYFLTASDGRTFLAIQSTVAFMPNILLLYLNDNVTVEQVVSSCGYTGTITNHLTGAYWERGEYGGFPEELRDLDREEYHNTLIGTPVTAIDPSHSLRNQLMEYIVWQLNHN